MSIISALSMAITAILAWVAIYRTNRVAVSFTGTPLDKSDFEKAEQAHHATHVQIFSKIGGVERGASDAMRDYEDSATESRRLMHKDIELIGKDVAALQATTELNTQTLVRVEAKFDRVLERSQ